MIGQECDLLWPDCLNWWVWEFQYLKYTSSHPKTLELMGKCGIISVLAIEILQSCTEPLTSITAKILWRKKSWRNAMTLQWHSYKFVISNVSNKVPWTFSITCCAQTVNRFCEAFNHVTSTSIIIEIITINMHPGACLDIKMSSYQYRNFLAVRPSYLYNGNPIPGKTVFILRQGSGISFYFNDMSLYPWAWAPFH